MVLGGAVTVLTWRATLVMAAPVAILVLLIAPFVLPPDADSGKQRASFDWAGAITITPGLLLFVFGVTNASAAGFAAPLTWGPLAAALALIVIFLVVEARHHDPMVPLSIFRRKKLSHANIVAALFQGVYVGFQFLATLYYQHVYGWSAFATCFSFALGGACVMFLAPRLAGVAQRNGTTKVMAIGVLPQAIGYVFRVLAIGRFEPITLVIVTQLFLGLGYAATYPSVQVAALADVEDDKSGLASGLLFASFQIGGGIVLAAVSAIFTAAPGFNWEPYIAGGAFVAALAVVTTLIAAVGPRSATSRVPSAVPQAAE